jgi:hypothetical protein
MQAALRSEQWPEVLSYPDSVRFAPPPPPPLRLRVDD